MEKNGIYIERTTCHICQEPMRPFVNIKKPKPGYVLLQFGFRCDKEDHKVVGLLDVETKSLRVRYCDNLQNKDEMFAGLDRGSEDVTLH